MTIELSVLSSEEDEPPQAEISKHNVSKRILINLFPEPSVYKEKNTTSTYGAVENRPALSFCYAVIEIMELNSTLRLLELADSNSTS
jgi:hypothetical protein